MQAVQTLSRDELRQTVLDVLETIAPEADFDALDPNADMREALEIDSFDFLNLVIGLNEALGVEIPEKDYGNLVTLNDMVAYLAARVKG